jgi:hypothetical protein
MPSTVVGSFSGGTTLVSGNLLSGSTTTAGAYLINYPYSFLTLKNGASGIGPIYVGLPPPAIFSGFVSGIGVTVTSGGSLSSGGLTDGFELTRGEVITLPRARLSSGLLSVVIAVPTASSGTTVFWDTDILPVN